MRESALLFGGIDILFNNAGIVTCGSAESVSEDTWSQTLNQLYDQDGSVYVIDWYDKNQCHHNREDGHDRSNGRIYKIVYNNQPMTHVDVAKLSEAELVKLVPSKNEFLSRHALKLAWRSRAPARPRRQRPGEPPAGRDPRTPAAGRRPPARDRRPRR